MPVPLRRRLPAVLLIAALGGLTACSAELDVPAPDLACPAGPAPTALVVGARANSAAPAPPEAVQQIIRSSLAAEAHVTIFSVDGAPAKAGEARFEPQSKNQDPLEREFGDFAAAFDRGLAKVRADDPESDLLAGLTLAAHEVGDGGVIVVLDSGLQTVAPLDFAAGDLIAAAPEEIAASLTQTGHLPDLSGRTVVFAGLGDVTDPQEQIPNPFKENLVAIWTELAAAAGACVEVIRQTMGAEPVDGDLPSVTEVAMPAEPDIDTCGDTVFDDASPVRFQPRTADFVDPDGASAALAEIADLILAQNQRAEIIGTTATWGTEEGRLQTSEDRAEAVAAVLIELGVPADRISTRGVGAEWPDRLDDIGPDGELIPEAAVHNRSVIIRLSCAN